MSLEAKWVECFVYNTHSVSNLKEIVVVFVTIVVVVVVFVDPET